MGYKKLISPEFRVTVGDYEVTDGIEVECFSSKESHMDWCRVELSPQLQGVLKFKDMDEASVELGYEDDFDSLIEGYVRCGDTDYWKEIMIKDDMMKLDRVTIKASFVDCEPQDVIRYVLACAGIVEAEATGTYYNIAPGRITISMIHLDGVDYVTNDDDWLFEEGAEEEDLEDLRDRCMSSWAELATRTIEEKLRNAAKAVPGVLDARIDAQHPRGQGTVDVIVTGAAGEASPELIRKVGEAIEPLKGNYEDYLVKSSEVVRQDFELVIYLAEDAATDGVDAQATKLIEDMMALTRGEMNTLYRDSIIQVLSTKIDNYRKTDILQPSDDMVLEQDKVIMAGDINVTVRNVVQSARGKE